MFPILVVVYVRLARQEENLAIEEFGNEYIAYKKATPGFIPTLKTLFQHSDHDHDYKTY